MTVLSDIQVGGSGTLERIDLPDDISDHLAHLGFLPGAAFEVLRRAPAGDPTVYRIDGLEVGLRQETACRIQIEETSAPAGNSADPSKPDASNKPAEAAL